MWNQNLNEVTLTHSFTHSYTQPPGVIHMCRGFDPLFWSSGYQIRSFWGVFSHPPTQKRSFGYKSSLNSIFLAPKYHFPLDLLGSNFQWPTAHPQQFSDRVPPPGLNHAFLHSLSYVLMWTWEFERAELPCQGFQWVCILIGMWSI